MNTFIRKWHFMRVFRAAIALWVIVEAWRTAQWLLLIPGGLFAIQAIFDVGCCGASGCSIAPNSQSDKPSSKEANSVVYEEVK